MGGVTISVVSRERSRPTDPLAANDVYDQSGGVRANIRAHKDIQGGVRSVGPSRMDATGVIGLLHT